MNDASPFRYRNCKHAMEEIFLIDDCCFFSLRKIIHTCSSLINEMFCAGIVRNFLRSLDGIVNGIKIGNCSINTCVTTLQSIAIDIC